MRLFMTLGLLAAALFCPRVEAQDHVLSLSNHSIAAGDSVTAAVGYDNTTASVVAGWSIGVCHDSSLVDVTGASAGSTTQTAKAGGPPDFLQTNVIPNGTEAPGSDPGANQAVVIDAIGVASLAPGTGYELFLLDYVSLGGAGTATIECCDTTVAAVPVTTVVVVSGASITPTQIAGSIEITGPAADDVLSFIDGATTVGGQATATCVLDNTSIISGWSIGICHDTALLDVVSAEAGSTTQTVKAGGPPDFLQINVLPNGTEPPGSDPGVNQAVVIDFIGVSTLGAGTDRELLDITYESIAGEGSATIEYCDTTVAAVTVTTVLVVAGASVTPDQIAGSIEISGGALPGFVRGDCNEDGVDDVADAVFNLEALFLAGPASGCPDACDANDDGTLDVADPVYLISFLMEPGSPPPSSPFPDCGDDPTADSLGCGGLCP